MGKELKVLGERRCETVQICEDFEEESGPISVHHTLPSEPFLLNYAPELGQEFQTFIIDCGSSLRTTAANVNPTRFK